MFGMTKLPWLVSAKADPYTVIQKMPMKLQRTEELPSQKIKIR